MCGVAGFVLLASTALALLVNHWWMLGVSAAYWKSTPALGLHSHAWFADLHALIPHADGPLVPGAAHLSSVGININVASALVLAHSACWTLFTVFVGGAMVWFAPLGYCVMANMLYWIGSEPRQPAVPEGVPMIQCATDPLMTHSDHASPRLGHIELDSCIMFPRSIRRWP